MPKFAVCDWSDVVWQIDTDKPALLPFPIHTGSGNVKSLAFTADQQFDMISGSSNATIHKTTGPKTDVLVYTEPMEYQVYLSNIRVRMVGFGEERIYFSSYDTAQGVEHIGEQIFQIRYLKNGAAIPYTMVYPSQVTIPNPCHPSEEIPAYISGDFAFGDDDTLYLSTGGLGGTNNIVVKVGVYKIEGAGPDKVSGQVQRIYLGDGPITGLCYRSPQTLYFLRDNDICSLDLKTMMETVLGTFPQQGGWPGAYDLAYVGNGLKQAQYWGFFSGVHAALRLVAATVWKSAMAIVIGRMPNPPRPRGPRPN